MMERYPVTMEDGQMRIEGFPDAVKVFRITGTNGQRLADLMSLRTDLEFALESLEQIDNVPKEPAALREALWRSAVIHFFKCFQQSTGRPLKLDPDQLFTQHEHAIEAFDYLKAIRNKHFVHDENSLAQFHPMAVLNKPDAEFKIAEIICSSVLAVTLVQDNCSNLRTSISHALAWVEAEFETLCEAVKAELEAESYDALLSREGATYTAPMVDEISRRRTAI